MKRVYHLLLILFLLFGLSRCRYIKNNFTEYDSVGQTTKLNFVEEDLFILRIREVPYVTDAQDEISELPFSIFKQIPDKRDTSSKVIEEAYIYLGNLQKGASEGPLLYFVTYPLSEGASAVVYNSTHYFSTYSVRKINIGKWERPEDTLLLRMEAEQGGLKKRMSKSRLLCNVLNLRSENEVIKMKAALQDGNLVITQISHPKPDVHTIYQPEDLMVDIDKVFNLNSEKGLLFLQNHYKREFIHPNWEELGRKQNKEELKDNHDKVFQTERITQIYIGQDSEGNYIYPLDFGIEERESGEVRYLRYESFCSEVEVKD